MNTQDVNWPGYYAKDPRRARSLRGRLAASYRHCKRALYDSALLPYGLKKHRELLASVDRTQHYTYTCFLRAPTQLATLAGPVIDFLQGHTSGKRVDILVFAASNGAEVYTFASWLMMHRPDLDFHIHASDLHDQMVERCIEGNYSAGEAMQSEYVTEEFLEATFELKGDRYLVRDEVKAHATFVQADLLDRKQLQEKFSPADIVVAQNVLFHLQPADATVAFENCCSLLKERSAFFVEGMDLDLRVQLTSEHKLEPLKANLKKIYKETRVHTPANWWQHYWGCEPYLTIRRDRDRRYGTIFVKQGPA